MKDEGSNEPESHSPEHHLIGHDRVQQGFERVGVLVNIFAPQIHFEVSHHVGKYESHEHDAGEGHDPLFANSSGIKTHWPKA